MSTWLITADSASYSHSASFAARGFIDWKKDRYSFEVGDIVYVYFIRPRKRIGFKTVVEKTNLTKETFVDDYDYWKGDKEGYYKGLENNSYVRLRLIDELIYCPELNLEHLHEHGLKGYPQGARRLDKELVDYIESCIDNHTAALDAIINKSFDNNDALIEKDSNIDNDVIDSDEEAPVFPETDFPDDAYEGSKKQVLVNKYERSAEARRLCIEYHGCRCSVCDMDFGEKYGEIGEGFIHVHHIVPLNEIGQEYKVDYRTDLIPVCPNCHAMLHRKINGEYPTVEELREMIK